MVKLFATNFIEKKKNVDDVPANIGIRRDEEGEKRLLEAMNRDGRGILDGGDGKWGSTQRPH